MSSLLLTTEIDAENPTLHDWKLENGQVVWVGLDETDRDDVRAMIRQRVHTALLHIKGEFFMDLRKGFPYLEDIFAKNPSERKIRSVLSRYIEQIPGVTSVGIGSVVIDHTNRTATISDIQITTDEGFVLTYQTLDASWLILKKESER